MKAKYAITKNRHRRSYNKVAYCSLFTVVLLIAGIFAVSKLIKRHNKTNPITTANSQNVQFDSGVSEDEKARIVKSISDHHVSIAHPVTIAAKTTFEASSTNAILSAYVPVTNIYASRQAVTRDEIKSIKVYVPTDTNDQIRASLASVFGLSKDQLLFLKSSVETIDKDAVALIPVDKLSSKLKLLSVDGEYYLDSFQKGAVYREAVTTGVGSASLTSLRLNDYPTKQTTLKVNVTGTTALTRKFIVRLPGVKTATYFSQKIGQFLADADITHVSNEVSFKQGCQVNDSVFCAPPQTIDTLKSSGVDLVELTGNHNNDAGAQANTDTIKLYHSLGWHTIGGGLNAAEAAKPYIADQKQSKVAFLAYNYADSPHGGPIATENGPGANSFDFDKIKNDIADAKRHATFVIVDVQYLECYAYPAGFTEFPSCDGPIPHQKDDFHHLADLGADMVIGTQAHHPQTFELYNGKPIYYGLGNLYFDQVEWPGTERGMILTHYFINGNLVQTKISPTVYDIALQTHLMKESDASNFLKRLDVARQASSL